MYAHRRLAAGKHATELVGTSLGEARRRWWLLLGLVVSLILYWSLWNAGGGQTRTMSPRQAFGTMLLFSAQPWYLIFCMAFLAARTREVADRYANLPQASALGDQLYRVPRWAAAGVVAGILFGADQNRYIIEYWLAGQALGLSDVVIFVGNIIVWAVVAFMLCWRIPQSVRIAALGEALPLSLYDPERAAPLRKLATYDVLIVMGAMALMPLQALDAEFRLVNYVAGTIIGLPAAITLFTLPLRGVQRNLAALKSARLAELQSEIDGIRASDTERLELVCAHRDRIRHHSTWPVDLQLATRLFSYLVIPPLAWIAAALVEGYIEQM